MTVLTEPTGVERKPLPLWLGFYGGLIATLIFLNAYKLLGETTAKGWLATVATAFELWGVLLIASPELRPIVERAMSANSRTVTQFGRRAKKGLRRLLRFPGGPQTVSIGGVVETNIAMPINVKGGYSSPGASATTEEKVDFLIQEMSGVQTRIETLENKFSAELDDLRKELVHSARDLRKHTAAAVREIAEAELRMRLLGVAFVVAGIALNYAANLA